MPIGLRTPMWKGSEKMPGTFLDADAGFPDLSGQGKTEEKLKAVSGYLYTLLEQLRYILNNLGSENFNETSFAEMAKTINEPVYVEIRDTQGNVAKLSVRADGIESNVQNLNGEFSTLRQTVDGLNIRTVDGQSSLSGVALNFYAEDGKTIIGQVNMDYDDNPVKGNSSYQMFIKSKQAPNGEIYALKLESAGDSSYVSKETIYVLADSNVFIKGPVGRIDTDSPNFNGDLTLQTYSGHHVRVGDGVKDGWYIFQEDGLYHNKEKIAHSEAQIRQWIREEMAAGASSFSVLEADVPQTQAVQENGETEEVQ